LVIVAVKTTFVPLQMLLPWLETIEMVGVAVLFTVIAMLLLFAVAGLGQLRLLTISQVTISPLFSAAETYVALLEPTGEPFTNHW
jgi:hypothetical protein